MKQYTSFLFWGLIVAFLCFNHSGVSINEAPLRKSVLLKCIFHSCTLSYTKLLLSRDNCKLSFNFSSKEVNNCSNISFVLLDGMQITLSECEKRVILRLLDICIIIKPISIGIFGSYALFSSITLLNMVEFY